MGSLRLSFFVILSRTLAKNPSSLAVESSLAGLSIIYAPVFFSITADNIVMLIVYAPASESLNTGSRDSSVATPSQNTPRILRSGRRVRGVRDAKIAAPSE